MGEMVLAEGLETRVGSGSSRATLAAAAPTSVRPLPAGMPLGRRSPRGRVRLYPVWAGVGHEASLCARLRPVLPDVIEGAFVPMRERWFGRGGAWSLQTAPLWRGYLLVASRDASALAEGLASLSFCAPLAGGRGVQTPLDDAAWEALSLLMDASHTLRNSTGVIKSGELRVYEGPLVGREALVRKIDRHARTCLVDLGGGRLVSASLDVPRKS